MAGWLSWLAFAGLLLASFPSTSNAVNVTFSPCLSQSVIKSTQLQWAPVVVNASYTAISGGGHFNLTSHGNVTGSLGSQPEHSGNDTLYWNNKTSSGPDKIIAEDPDTNTNSTIFVDWNVLSYTVVHQGQTDFCKQTSGCPLSPVFSYAAVPEYVPISLHRTAANSSRGSNNQYTQLPSFSVASDFYGNYAFTTINAVVWVKAGDKAATEIVCVSAEITPDLGATAKNLLTFLPVLILILVAVATAAAAILSPWGTWNVFHWTTNFGRDSDQLRLITPGFGDCLNYLQFIILSGSLTLDYPGFFQPAVSRVAWSSLMFNHSFVTGGPGFQAVEDGVYNLNQTSGLISMSKLNGLASSEDIWPGFMVWLLVIIGAFFVLSQIFFGSRVMFRLVTRTHEEDLRAKNWPFFVGNVIRIVFNLFLFPLVSLSMYQLYLGHVDVPDHPSTGGACLAMAAITIVILLGFSGWLLYQIISTRPRAYLFDDLPTLLLYGPLYNTYSDDAATFALVPVFITFLRGIAIGACQSSSIAQIVLLAISEVILILTLNAFRPFSSPTSMNAYHTIFSVVRLITIFLMVTFIPGLTTTGIRGWVGYIILLLHAIVLFLGFFIHSLQTLIEVVARMLGAGGEGNGAMRGGLVKVSGNPRLCPSTS